MAFVGTTPLTDAIEVDLDGSCGLAVVGNDTGCNDDTMGQAQCSLASGNDELTFAILVDGSVIVLTHVDPPITFSNNGFDKVPTATYKALDGSDVVPGCQDDTFLEYNPDANYVGTKDHCETPLVEGCEIATACNYNVSANSSKAFAGDIYDSSICVELEIETDDCEDCTDGNTGLTAGYNDPDGDGVCNADEIPGAIDPLACNYNAAATDDDGSAVFADDPCEVCENGDVVLKDDDGDGYCNIGSGLEPQEVLGCNDTTKFNFSSIATEDDGSCIDKAYGCTNPVAENFDSAANTDDGSCTIKGVPPYGQCEDGTIGTEVSPRYVTSNNMSVLFPVENTASWDATATNINNGAIIMAVYDTASVVSDLIGYDAVSGIASAGATVWDGNDQGMPIFGLDPGKTNGFDEGQELIWIVFDEGTYYNASVAYVDEFDGTYDDGAFVAVKSITVGPPFYEGCTDAGHLEFNPLAGDDDGSCATKISVGCLDSEAINYAGADANPTHNSANNKDDVFVENLLYDLNSGVTTGPSGVAANFHDQSMCQTQIEGCMQYMATNYDVQATFNLDTECNFNLDGLEVYDIDAYGVPLLTE
jgi:hypothetical protein